MIIQKISYFLFIRVKCIIYDEKYELLLLFDKNRKRKRIKNKTKNEIKSEKLVFAIF